MKGVCGDTRDNRVLPTHGGRGRRIGTIPFLLGGFVAFCCLADAWHVVAQEDAPSARGEKPSARADKTNELDGLVPEEDEHPWKPKPLSEPNEEIVDVRVEGNTTIPAASITKFVKSRAGRIPNNNQVREDVRALYKTRWFFNVEPRYERTEEGLVLVFKVLEQPIVKSVEYKGNKKIKTKNLSNLTGLVPRKSAYSKSANREAVERILQHYHEKGFAEAKVSLEKGDKDTDRDVIFLIDEGPKVHVVSRKFSGNRFFSSQLLKSKLKTKTSLVPMLGWHLIGGKYDPGLADEDVASLKEYYHSLGFFSVTITPIAHFSDDRADVTMEYIIEEGLRYKVRDTEIEGNEVLSEARIRKHLDAKKSDDYFNAERVNKAVEKVKDDYGEMGRLFASVEMERRFLEEPGVVDLIMHINEDVPYRIRRIEPVINGDHPHTNETVILNALPFAPGDLANSKKIDLGQKRLKGGGIFGNGQNNTTPPKMDLRKVEENTDDDGMPRKGRVIPASASISSPQSTVRAQAFSGTPPVSRRRTKSSQSAPTGQVDGPTPYVFTPPATSGVDPDQKLIVDLDATENTYRQAMRGDETIVRAQGPTPNTPPGSTFPYTNDPLGDPNAAPADEPAAPTDLPPRFIDIYPNVSEAQTGKIMFGLGVNSSSGLVGSAVLEENNFDITRPPTSFQDILNGTAWRGDGQQFRLEAVPGTQLSRYAVTWRDPYFLDTPNSFGVSGFYFNRFYRNWTETRTGGRVTVGRQLNPFTSGTFALRLEDVQLSNPTNLLSPLLDASLGYHLLSTARFGIQHDTRDSAFLATEGHFVEAAYEQAFGTYNYSMFTVDGKQFFTLYQRPDGQGKHILTLSGQLAFTGHDTPIFERFFAGGYQNFRGFQFRGVSPVQDGIYVGGTFMSVGTVEYMFPVIATEAVRGVVFSDFGTVDNTVTYRAFRATAGFGTRVSVPMLGAAPIALDFAFPITRQGTDVTQVFSFYVGFTR